MRLLKYIEEEGETTAGISGGTTTPNIAKFEPKLTLARRRRKKKRMFPKTEDEK
jgi:hypothetical protein